MIGQNRNLVTLEEPIATTMDGAGGYVDTWGPLDPATWYCAVEDATASAMERAGFGTAFGQATHILTGRYHPGLSTNARVHFGSRAFSVLSAGNRNERNMQSVILCAELVK